jgi:hypothetical protein
MAFLLEKTFHAMRNIQLRRRQSRALVKWQKEGQPNPPPHRIKQQVLLEHSRRFGLEILVETGTYRGDMVQFMKDSFAKVYSIELSDQLFEAARRRFHGQANVEIIHGDSGEELAKLIPRLDRPTLFWLDGHYSAGRTARGAKVCPVLEELNHIFNSSLKTYAIVIDDARFFGTDPGYPSLGEVQSCVYAQLPDAEIQIDTDSIRITRKIKACLAA